MGETIKRKNPWVAAILNFFLPGIGFIYSGTAPLIIAGAILFIIEIWSTIAFWHIMLSLHVLVASLLLGFLWATLGYVAAEYVNKKRMPPPILPPPAAPPPPTPTPLEKVYCVYCGAENPVDAVFCRKCGKKIMKPA